MEITIKGNADEIAAFVLATQGRRPVGLRDPLDGIVCRNFSKEEIAAALKDLLSSDRTPVEYR